MVDCEFISTSPDRPNIYYEVRPRTEIDTDMKTIICSLKEHKNKAPHVVVYCRTLDICADLYAHFHYELGNDSYYPPGSHKISDNRLFGMFHANTPKYNKEVIFMVQILGKKSIAVLVNDTCITSSSTIDR